MTIHKFFRLFSLTVASFFWASCGGDSNPQLPVFRASDPDSSSDANESSSSELSSSAVAPESSSSEMPQQSSSSESASSSSRVESSSSANSSSSSAGYVLARDPSVGCKQTLYPAYRYCYESCDAAKRDLETNGIISKNELERAEFGLESCRAMEYISSVVYGVPFNPCPKPIHFEPAYECSNDSTYKEYWLEDNLVYTSVAEYNEAHGVSSSSVPQSSSSSEEMIRNCPQEDYLPFTGILADVQKELYEIIEQKLKDDVLSETERTYLESLLDREQKTLKNSTPHELHDYVAIAPYSPDLLWDDYYYKIDSKNWFRGYIAKTKTCEDGTPVITERYKQKYDAILAECLKIIETNAKTAEDED
ncbi:hypothetical protein [Fibrobacter sp. UWB7]|uniref:hypothetical protein n=1 Tax=Fibrobacter sp. UWB7 TaxID=1896206 RepID=UPI00090FC03A|nr:hypothetical protein [Fibrobacter sp. UWB7]SHM63076.1 hypothetical protein SAMN05720467_1990 [Fibrobacter sp. UWB7]